MACRPLLKQAANEMRVRKSMSLATLTTAIRRAITGLEGKGKRFAAFLLRASLAVALRGFGERCVCGVRERLVLLKVGNAWADASVLH